VAARIVAGKSVGEGSVMGRTGRLIAVLSAVVIIVTIVSNASGPASAAGNQKVKKVLVCSWDTSDKEGTFGCHGRMVRPPAMATITLPTCWAQSPIGAYAQQRIKGGWVDRPDIPVVLEENGFDCEARYSHSAAMTVTIPSTSPFTAYIFRIMAPATDSYAATAGIPAGACVKPTHDFHMCK
jgi:hypothetical protein